jgi:cyanophycinase
VGNEDKEGERTILSKVARRARRGRNGRRSKEGSDSKQLVITAVASSEPEELIRKYKGLFGALGVEEIGVLRIETPEDAHKEESAQMVKDADVLFFTGGDQLRNTSLVRVTPVYEAMCDMYRRGGTIVGTSAGAAAMSETMLIVGDKSDSFQMRAIDMGLGWDCCARW